MKISTQKEKTSKASVFGKIGIFSASLLAASSAVYLYSPVIGTHADSSANADFDVEINEVMSLSLDKEDVNLSANMYSFASSDVNALVSTNSQYGYTLTLEDKDNDTNMVHKDSSISSVVTSNFSGKKTSSEMPDNTWGFSINDTDFYKIPVKGSPFAIRRTGNLLEAISETATVKFGAKIGNITSGSYSDVLMFTLYTNGQDDAPTKPPMQDIDCDTMNIGSTITAIDNRDNNSYRISKLDDGKCWMTQNLRLVGPLTLTPENSNVAESWTLPARPTEAEGVQWNSKMSYEEGAYEIVEYRDSGDANVGVHYTYAAATAGTFINPDDGSDSQYSICPKGWRMPSFQEYETLFNVSGIIHNSIVDVRKATSAPYNFTYSGYYELNGMAPLSIGTDGFWFTSTAYYNDGEDNLVRGNRLTIDIGTNTIVMRSAGDMRRGFSVRCVSE